MISATLLRLSGLLLLVSGLLVSALTIAQLGNPHPLFRNGLGALLASVPDTEAVGEAGTGDEVIAFAGTLLPDVIQMDIKMAGVNGIEATRQSRCASPHMGILVLTMLEDDFVFAAMRAGARGYLPKGASQTDTLRAIRAVANGEAIFNPNIAQRLIAFFSAGPAATSPQVFPELTDREWSVWCSSPRGAPIRRSPSSSCSASKRCATT